MGRITTLRDLIGIIKDKVWLSKAAVLSNPDAISLHRAVLRVTAHTPSDVPPDDHRISVLLSIGDSSRSIASALVTSLVDRLHRTRNSTVALKCLLVFHHIIKRGPFILQDQLSIFPATGGHNYLKLSGFRDGATAVTWVLSAWVRWYARYVETLLATSRALGYFLGYFLEKDDKEEERMSSLLNEDLIRDVDSLVGVIEELCKIPDPNFIIIEGNKLLNEIVTLLTNDYLTTVNELVTRLSEFNERTSCLSFGESVELICALKRLKDSKEKVSVIFKLQKASALTLWGLIDELKDKIEKSKVENKEERKVMMMTWWGKSDKAMSESARFGRSVVKLNDSVLFPSGRIRYNW